MILIGVPTMGTIPIKVAASLFSLAKKPDMELIFTRNSLVYDARHTFRIVDSKTAELCKYMENSFLATKVAFCIQF